MSVVNGTYDVDIASRFHKNRGTLKSSENIISKLILFHQQEMASPFDVKQFYTN